MSRKAAPHVGPVARLTFGVVALVVSILMVLDLVFGLIPDREGMKRQLRQQFTESLAVQVASLIEVGDERTLGKTLHQVVSRNPEVLSVAVRQAAGYITVQRGDHARHWIAQKTGRSTLNHVRVPIHGGSQRWGDLEIAFAETSPKNLGQWLTDPTVLLLGTFSVGGMLIFYPYLRRALHFLDPSAAIPDRVRKAFDALTDGVVVVAPDGRIVLANNAFRKIAPAVGEDLHGRKLSELAWLKAAQQGDAPEPWDAIFRDGKPIEGYPLTITPAKGEPIEMIVGCAPIADNDGRLRGCLVTFDDVTEIHRMNEQLRKTLTELEQSREKIQAQNEELRTLATRDPMTGCLNRRAFFERGGELFEQGMRTNHEVTCIMTDIDHFKSFNDLYGHSVGDQVIQTVARTLSRNTRTQDVLCRYGGEEFCILLPDTDLVQAQSIAERMREDIEFNAVEAIRSTRAKAITSSFGVASLNQGAVRLEELIDNADNALYKSKEAGRNCVTSWQPE